jgi:hypothetical protein
MVRYVFILCLVFSSLAGITGVQAMERFDIISTGELYRMLEKREKGEVEFTLLNSLDEIIADDKTIPGSIHIPWGKIETQGYKLGKDKNKLIVTYCMGYR